MWSHPWKNNIPLTEPTALPLWDRLRVVAPLPTALADCVRCFRAGVGVSGEAVAGTCGCWQRVSECVCVCVRTVQERGGQSKSERKKQTDRQTDQTDTQTHRPDTQTHRQTHRQRERERDRERERERERERGREKGTSSTTRPHCNRLTSDESTTELAFLRGT